MLLRLRIWLEIEFLLCSVVLLYCIKCFHFCILINFSSLLLWHPPSNTGSPLSTHPKTQEALYGISITPWAPGSPGSGVPPLQHQHSPAQPCHLGTQDSSHLLWNETKILDGNYLFLITNPATWGRPTVFILNFSIMKCYPFFFWNYPFLIYLEPNRIPVGAKSIGEE